MKKLKSYNKLPDDYILSYDLNMKNKGLFIWLNVLSVIILIPFLIAYIIYIQATSFTLIFDIQGYSLTLAGLVLMIIIHELIHGIFFKMGTREKVSYKFHGWAFSASVKGIYFYYLLVGLAPFVILSPIFILLMFIFPTYSAALYFILALHTSACVGDFYVIYKLLKYPEDSLIHDYGIGMSFYIKER